MPQLISQETHTLKSPLTADMWRGFIYKSHKSKHSWLTQPSGCMSGPIRLHHHITGGIRGVEALWQTHTSMCTHTNTHTHIHTLNGDHLAGPKQSFSAGFVLSWTHLSKGAQSCVLKNFHVFFSDLGPSISKLVFMYTLLTYFWHLIERTVHLFQTIPWEYFSPEPCHLLLKLVLLF